jgi:hypothetical protein
LTVPQVAEVYGVAVGVVERILRETSGFSLKPVDGQPSRQ